MRLGTRFSYPVLHFFVERERRTSIEPAVVALDEALLLLEVAVSPDVGVDRAVIGDVRWAVAAYLDTLEDEHLKAADEVPPLPSLEPLRDAGIPLVRSGYSDTLTAQERRRRLLGALLEHERVALQTGSRYEVAFGEPVRCSSLRRIRASSTNGPNGSTAAANAATNQMKDQRFSSIR